MILILTDEFDVHANTVISKISDQTENVFRLNLDVAALRKTSITYLNGIWSVTQGDCTVVSSEVKSVWSRRLTVYLTSEQENDISNGFRIWRSEWNRMLFGFYSGLSSAFWLSHIRHATMADNKFYQVATAKACGLRVPELISSNLKQNLIQFAEEKGDVALKFMAQDLYRSSDGNALGLYVNKIGASDLQSFGDLSENPVTLQSYVEKDFEVRYTVVEDDHLVCRISSQISDRTKIDWRRYDIPSTPHAAMEPNAVVKASVMLLMDKLNLAFGALDFIVDKEGGWWFLEINSAGQWLWIEDLTGLQISDSITRCLIKHAN